MLFNVDVGEEEGEECWETLVTAGWLARALPSLCSTYLAPPVPLLLVKSPVWNMKLGMTLWTFVFGYEVLHSWRKLSQVRGRAESKSSKVKVPQGVPPIEKESETGGRGEDIGTVRTVKEGRGGDFYLLCSSLERYSQLRVNHHEFCVKVIFSSYL